MIIKTKFNRVLGLQKTKFNRVLEYTQDNYMKQYTMLTTEIKTKATTKFEKDSYKLMNNSVYGKTMENVRNRINLKLISTEEQVLSLRTQELNIQFLMSGKLECIKPNNLLH